MKNILEEFDLSSTLKRIILAHNLKAFDKHLINNINKSNLIDLAIPLIKLNLIKFVEILFKSCCLLINLNGTDSIKVIHIGLWLLNPSPPLLQNFLGLQFFNSFNDVILNCLKQNQRAIQSTLIAQIRDYFVEFHCYCLKLSVESSRVYNRLLREFSWTLINLNNTDLNYYLIELLIKFGELEGLWEYITSNRYYFQWRLNWLHLITKNLAQLIKPVKLKQIGFLAENLAVQNSLSFTNEISLKGFALWFRFQKIKLMSYQIGAAGSSLEGELVSIKRDLIKERDLPPIRVNNYKFDLKLKQQWIALHEHYFHQSEALHALHNFKLVIIDSTCSINLTCKVLVDDIMASLKVIIDDLSPHFNLTYAFQSIQLYYSILNQYNYRLDYLTGCLDLTEPITWQKSTTPCLIDPVDLILTNKLKLTNPSIPPAIKHELNLNLKKLVKRVELWLKPSQLEDFSFKLEDFITIMANFLNTPIWNNILIQLFPKLHWKASNNNSKLTLKDIELFLINLIIEKLSLIMNIYKIQEFSQFQLIWQKSQNFITENQNSFWYQCKLQFGNLSKLKYQTELMPDQVFNQCLGEIRGQKIHISHWGQFQFIEDLYARLGARLTQDHPLYSHYNNLKFDLKFGKFESFLIIKRFEVKKTLRPILYFHTMGNAPRISEKNSKSKYITGVKPIQQTNYTELTQSQLEYLIKCNLQIEAQQKSNINTEPAVLPTEALTSLKKDKFAGSATTKPKMLNLNEPANCPNLVPDDLYSPNLSPCTLITPIDSNFLSYPSLA